MEEVIDTAASRRPAGTRPVVDGRARTGAALIACCALAACDGSGGGGAAPLPLATVTDVGLIASWISGLAMKCFQIKPVRWFSIITTIGAWLSAM